MKETSFFIDPMDIKVTTLQLFLGMDITPFVISKIQQRLSWYSDLGWEWQEKNERTKEKDRKKAALINRKNMNPQKIK